MRTTIGLVVEIHPCLLAHARNSGRTLSEAVARLMRDGMNLAVGAPARGAGWTR